MSWRTDKQVMPVARAILLSLLVTSSVAAQADNVYWAQRLDFGDLIVRSGPDGANPTQVIGWPAVDQPLAIAVDAIGGKIYWSQTFGNPLGPWIRSADLTGSGATTLVSWPALNNPVAIAYDRAHGKICWAQRALLDDRIVCADAVGTNIQTLLSWPDVRSPAAVVVDSAGGKIYWAENVEPNEHRIARADLDGSNVEDVVLWPDVEGAVGIGIDPVGGKIYWAQRFENRIQRADLNGNSVESLLDTAVVNNPIAFAVDPAGGKFYWIESAPPTGSPAQIRRADLSGANPATIVPSTALTNPVAIALSLPVGPGCGDGLCDAAEDHCGCGADCPGAETTELTCDDTLDNDCDGAADCADSDCAATLPCTCGNENCDPGEDDTNCPSDCQIDSIPALSNWGVALMVLLMTMAGALVITRRRLVRP